MGSFIGNSLQDVSWGSKNLCLSTGATVQAAQSYLLSTRTRVIDAYYSFCSANGYTNRLGRGFFGQTIFCSLNIYKCINASDSGKRMIYCILEKLPLKKATALQGIDNTVAAAKESLNLVQQTVAALNEKSVISADKKAMLSVTLKAVERHLQDDLNSCVSLESSCADRCLSHALTDSVTSFFRTGLCTHTEIPGHHPVLCSVQSSTKLVF